MPFNSKKCHILSICKQRVKPSNTYTLGAENLSRVDSYPYLGVTVSSDLSWHNHVSCISTKATRTLNFIRRNIYGCSSEAKALAYTSLVRPHLEYAASAWDPHLIGDVTQLEGVQRRAARFACKDYRHTTSVTGLLERLHWPSLSVRRSNSRLVTFYKAVNNKTAISTSHLQKPTRCTRNSDDTTYIPISLRTNCRKFSFFRELSTTGTNYHRTSASSLQFNPSGKPYHLINNNLPAAMAPAITGARPLLETTEVHIISVLLESNPYVIVFALDFSKAFDSVRHSAVIEKFCQLILLDNIYNWIESFFRGHSHCTKFGQECSGFQDIMASII
jgi:hypothetical protein